MLWNKKFTLVAILVILALLVLPLVVLSQSVTWYKRTSGTVMWDAVAKVDPADDAVRYQVYYRLEGTTAPIAVGSPITAVQLAVTPPADKRVFYGVQAIRYKAGAQLGDPSTIAWSDVVANVAGGITFGFDTIIQIGAPGGMRLLNP